METITQAATTTERDVQMHVYNGTLEMFHPIRTTDHGDFEVEAAHAGTIHGTFNDSYELTMEPRGDGTFNVWWNQTDPAGLAEGRFTSRHKKK